MIKYTSRIDDKHIIEWKELMKKVIDYVRRN